MKKLAITLSMILILTGCNTEIQIKEVEQTNENLVIYIDAFDNKLKIAADIFRSKYPDIPLEIVKPESNVPGDALREENLSLLSSLMAGSGPDVLCSSTFSYLSSLEKWAYDGIAADMSEFYDDDNTLDSTINHTIMDSGVVDGKRCFFPLDYTIPLLLSTENTLEKFNLSPDSCTDYLSFLSKTGELIENDVSIFSNLASYMSIFNASGIKILDAEKSVLNIDHPELKTSFDWVKSVVPRFTKDDLNWVFSAGPEPQNLKAVCNGEIIFTTIDTLKTSVQYQGFAKISKLLLSVDETPVIFPIRNVNGGLTALVNETAFVRANSPNKENAYKFIQILLSKEFQEQHNVRAASDISVLRSAMDSYYVNTLDWIFGEIEGFPTERPQLPEELHNEYLSYTDQIDTVLLDYASNNISQSMDAYYLDEETYDECIAKAKEKREFRMSV